MVNYFIYARDCSFSTLNNEYYHINGLKTLEQFKRDVDNIKEELAEAREPPTDSKIIYLHWGDECWDVDEKETRIAYLKRHGEQMGSEPTCIIQHLQKKYINNDNDKIKLLYIITDGLISNERAKKSFRWNDFMHYETFVFHAFNEDISKINLSVAASFFKSRCLVYRNYKLYASTDISSDFKYEKIDIYNFSTEKDRLKCYIMLKFIDEFSHDSVTLQEIENLKKLRDRLLNELTLETLDIAKIEANSHDRDEHNNRAFVLKIVSKGDIEKSISTLINYILSEEKSYSFEALKFDKFDNPSEEVQIDEIEFSEEEEIEMFDFILEENVGIPYGNRSLLEAT